MQTIYERHGGFPTIRRVVADFYERVVAATRATPKTAANWVIGELTAALNREGPDVAESKIEAEALGELLDKIEDGTISGKIAKDVFEAVWNGAGGVAERDVDRSIGVAHGGADHADEAAQLLAVLARLVHRVLDVVAGVLEQREALVDDLVGDPADADGQGLVTVQAVRHACCATPRGVRPHRRPGGQPVNRRCPPATVRRLSGT